MFGQKELAIAGCAVGVTAFLCIYLGRYIQERILLGDTNSQCKVVVTKNAWKACPKRQRCIFDLVKKRVGNREDFLAYLAARVRRQIDFVNASTHVLKYFRKNLSARHISLNIKTRELIWALRNNQVNFPDKNLYIDFGDSINFHTGKKL